MTEVSIFAVVGALIAFVLLKGYTTKAMGQLRHESSSLIVEERRLSGERDQQEILVESADAKFNQAEYELQKFTQELEELATDAEKIGDELGQTRDGDEGV